MRIRLSLLFAALLITAGCGSGDSPLSDPNARYESVDFPVADGPTPTADAPLAKSVTPIDDPKEAMDAIRQITVNAGELFEVTYSENLQTPSFISLHVPAKTYLERAPHNKVEASAGFLRRYRGLYQLSDETQALRLRRVTKDFLGSTHLRYAQYHHNIPVFGAEVIVHINKDDVVTAINGHLSRPHEVETIPALSRERAGQIVQLEDSELSAEQVLYNPAFFYEDRSSELVLAWKVETPETGYMVQAQTGEILFRYGLKFDALEYHIYDSHGTTNKKVGADLRVSYIDGLGFIFQNGYKSGNDSDIDDFADFADETYLYYFNQFKRDSFDGLGGAIVINANYDVNNAFWSQDVKQMAFGDGYDGAKDVFAHEFTHAITQHTAGLIYQGQSGAINEAMSDFFGVMVEHDSDWWIFGENSPGKTTATPTRNMKDPTMGGQYDAAQCNTPGKPDHTSVMATPTPTCSCYVDENNVINFDHDCVHINSGIINKASFLIAREPSEGSETFHNVSVAGIGKTKIEQIYYRALTVYLGPTSNFYSLRNSLYQSCKDLAGEYGITAANCNTVLLAYDAVGIGNSSSPTIYSDRSIYGYNGQPPSFQINTKGNPDYIVEIANDWRLFDPSPTTKAKRKLVGSPDVNFISSYDISGGFLNTATNNATFQIPADTWQNFRKNLWKDWDGNAVGSLKTSSGKSVAGKLESGGNVYYRVMTSPNASLSTLSYSVEDVDPSSQTTTVPLVSIAKSHPSGTLIKQADNPTVYVLDGGYRRKIPSENSFNNHRFSWNKIVIISFEEMDSYSKGDDYSETNNFKLYKEPGSATVWYKPQGDGVLRPIQSEDAFFSWGFKWSEVVTVPNVNDYGIKSGNPLYLRDGTLVREKSSNAIYAIAGEVARWIENEDIYYALYNDYDFKLVTIIPDGTLLKNSAGKGLILNKGSVSKQSDVLISDGGYDPNSTTDTTKPSVSVGSLPSTVNAGNTLNINWTVSDNKGVVATYLYYTLDGWQSSAQVTSANLSPGSSTSKSGTTSWTVPNAATSEAAVRIVANDAAGNVGIDYSTYFTIQPGAPPQENFTISGTVTNQFGNGVKDAEIAIYNLTNGNYYGKVTTNSSGFYKRESLVAGTYKVTIYKDAHTFSPSLYENIVLNASTPNATANFSATWKTYEIGGEVAQANGTPVAGVTVTAVGPEFSATTSTNANGQFTFNLPFGTYVFTPTHPNYSMSPVSKTDSVYNSYFGLGPVDFTASSKSAQFIEVSESIGITGIAWSFAVAVGDYDNDGDEDIYVNNHETNPDRPNRLYRNNGNGTFTNIAAEAGVADVGQGFAAVWADYNGDGWLDLYITNYIGYANRLYKNNGNSTFTDMAPGYGLSLTDKNTWGAAFGDYDGDGDLDLFVGIMGEPNRLFRNENGTGFTDVTDSAKINNYPDSQGASATWIDMDLDGDQDLSVGLNTIYINNGDGTFEWGGIGMSDSYGHAWGDFNNDGFPDLLQINAKEAGDDPPDKLYKNNGLGGFIDVTLKAGLGDKNGYTGSLADFDNDGDLDIFRTSGLWSNNGDETFTDVTSVTGITGCDYACVWLDYNNDGVLDVYIGELNADKFFQGVPNGRKLLKVKLSGSGMNKFGIGARVILTTPDGKKQYRQLYNGTGWGDSASPFIYFGLGSYDKAESLRVIWPSGTEDEIYDVTGDATATIGEGEHQDVTAPDTITDLVVTNKTTSSVTIGWSAPGDDGALHTAKSYDVRYYVSPISDANWDVAYQANGEVLPAAPGTWQQHTIKALEKNKQYYFAVRTTDEMGNVSAISNTVSEKVAYGTAIYDLSAGSITQNSVALSWTVPDIPSGSYVIAYSKNSISASNWNEATQITPSLPLGVKGDIKSYAVTGLTAGTTYYFAVRIDQGGGSLNDISNVISTATQVGALNLLDQLLFIDTDNSLPVQPRPIMPAGDVNKDGYDDFLLVEYAGAGAGKVSLFYGSANPDSVADLIFAEAGGNYGHRTEAIGDINHDGYDDIAIGEMYANGGLGEVYIYFGGSAMDNGSDVILDGIVPGMRFGAGVGALGDLNKDGIDDLLVATESGGNAYIYFGSASFGEKSPEVTITWPSSTYYGWASGDINNDGQLDLAIVTSNQALYLYFGANKTLPSSPSHTITLQGATYDVDMGDVNGDGFDDILVSSYQNKAYLIWGGPSLPSSPDITFTNNANDSLGQYLTLIDLNNDGFKDIALSARYADQNAGHVEVYLGAMALDTIPDLLIKNPKVSTYNFGSGVVDGGDVNKDGFHDLIIATSQDVYIYKGRNGLLQKDDTTAPDAINNLQLSSDGTGELLVTWVSTGDDSNQGKASFYDLRYLARSLNDGTWNKALEATDEPPPLPAGYVQSYTFTSDQLAPDLLYNFGIKANDEWLATSDLSNVVTGKLKGKHPFNHTWTIGPEAGVQMVSYSAQGGLDFNKDGFTDLVVGNNKDSKFGYNSGALYFYLGDGTVGGTSDLVAYGEKDGDMLGYKLAAGDVNGDGFDDVLAKFDDTTIRIYHGSSPMNATYDAAFTPPGSYNHMITANINGDPFDDLIVRSEYEYKYYIYLGGAPFNTAHDYEISGKPDDKLGQFTDLVVGDFNGDKFDDLVVQRDVPEDETVYQEIDVYFGGVNFDTTYDVAFRDTDSNSMTFGRSMMSVGDVNNDGYDDLVIGDGYKTDTFNTSGVAYLYLGGSNFNSVYDYKLTPPPFGDYAYFAEKISRLGDVNNDGFDDFLVNAKKENSQKVAFIYLGSASPDTLIDATLDKNGNGFTETMAYAGDVDNDGYADILLGNMLEWYLYQYDHSVKIYPVALAGGNQTVAPNSLVTLQGSAQSGTGNIQSFTWVQVAGLKVTLSDPTVPGPTFTAPATEGTLTFRLVVADEKLSSVADTVDVIVEADADGDGIADTADNCPTLSNPDQTNSDDDELGDLCDLDDDNDNVLDENDAFPLSASESVDTDGDGIGNNADLDDDGDSVTDIVDLFPLDKTESADSDGDGVGNNADPDDDNDGLADIDDPYPFVIATTIHYWPFNENKDCTAKDIDQAIHGMLKPSCPGTNHPTWTTAGALGKALSFDGVDDYVVFRHSPTYHPGVVSDFTVSLWANVSDYVFDPNDSASQVKVIASAGISDDSGWVIATRKTSASEMNVSVQIFGGNSAISIQQAILPGVYHHIAVTYDADQKTAQIHINGEKFTNQSNEAMMDPSVGDYFAVGGKLSTEPGHYMKGSIDEIHSFGGVLTDDEILGLYTDEYEEPPPPVEPEKQVTYTYHLDEGSGNGVKPAEGGPAGTLGPNAASGNAPKWTPNAVSNSALLFDGSDDVVQFESGLTFEQTDPSPFTASLWVKLSDYPFNPTDAAKNLRLLSTGGLSLNGGWALITRKNVDGTVDILAQIMDDGVNILASHPMTPNAFHHVATTYDDAKKRLMLYVGGDPSYGVSGFVMTPAIRDYLSIGGKKNNGDSNYINAIVDEFSIHKKVLSTSEILDLMNAFQ